MEEIDRGHVDPSPELRLHPIEPLPITKSPPEVSGKPGRIKHPNAVGLIDSQPAASEHPAGDVGGFESPVRPLMKAFEFGQYDREGIRLFSRCRRSAPDPERPAVGHGLPGRGREQVTSEKLKVVRLAKEVGVVCRDEVDELLGLLVG